MPENPRPKQTGATQKSISGLEWQYNDFLKVMVNVGRARSDDDNYNIDLTVKTLLDCTQSTAINGILYNKTGAGTVTFTNGSGTVPGVGTNFLTLFGTRALSAGTMGTGGVASTTITGVGTKFTDDVHLGDLVGASGGTTFASVTAVTSDTLLTVSSNLTIAAGASGLVIENPTISSPTQTTSGRVTAIASATSLTSSNTVWVAAATVQPYVGRQAASSWYYIWLVYGTTGAGLVISTQRTDPTKHGATMWAGYTTAKRLIGAVWCPAGTGNQYRPWYMFRGTDSRAFVMQGGTAFLSSGVAATYTRFSWIDETAPAIADGILLEVESQSVAGRAVGTTALMRVGFDGTSNFAFVYSGSPPTTVTTNIGAQNIWFPRGSATNNVPAAPAVQGRGIPGGFYLVSSATQDLGNLASSGWTF